MNLPIPVHDIAAHAVNAIDRKDQTRPTVCVGAFEGYIYREVEDDCRLAAIGFSGYL